MKTHRDGAHRLYRQNKRSNRETFGSNENSSHILCNIYAIIFFYMKKKVTFAFECINNKFNEELKNLNLCLLTK